MPEFPRLTKLPKTNCLSCGATARLVDGRLLENSWTMPYQARKKIVRNFVSLWTLLGRETWTACWFGGSIGSPEACHIWSRRLRSSESAVLILPPTKSGLTPPPRRESSCSGSSPHFPNSSATSFKNEFTPASLALAQMASAWVAHPLTPTSSFKSDHSPARHLSERSQLELALASL